MAKSERLTDEQWAILEPLIAEPFRRDDGRGRSWRENREVLDGILWILRTGARWQVCAADRKNALVAADLLNDQVLPFFEAVEIRLLRILIDRGSGFIQLREIFLISFLKLTIRGKNRGKRTKRQPVWLPLSILSC